MIPEAFGLLLALLFILRTDYAYYSIRSVGSYKRLQRHRVRTGECSDDACDTDAVERRTAAREYVLFGSVVYRRRTARNHYCDDHASFEYHHEDIDRPALHRHISQLVTVIVGLSEVVPDTAEPLESDNQFKDVSKGVNEAFNLVGVAFVVLTIAVLIAPVAALRK